MSPARRAWLQAALAAGAAALAAKPLATTDEDSVRADRRLVFPRDHGAHPGARIEWWYATGWLQAAGEALFGFQLTFFRSRTGLVDAPGSAPPGRFAPRQLLFAHAAVSDITAGRHHHAQRISRWSGDEALVEAHALRADTALSLGRWALQRAADGAYRALLAAPEAGFTLDLQLQPTQPLLLQGEAGHSRKGPLPSQASHYYTQPQLAVTARLVLGGKAQALSGRGWLDHEWSDELLAPGATGWDWIGINLADGGALTAFRLRNADDGVVWAGGSHRPANGAVRNFSPDELRFTALRTWTSPDTGARYPVHWRLQTPVGSFELRSLLDAQELDSRASTGTVYWEGLTELLDSSGSRRGLGYLEMTGRAQPLRLGL